MFTQEEKMQLFNRLPALELSYEPKLHKKVYSSMYYIIPKGPKALVWYTYWREDHVCLLILLNERGNYSDIKLFPACFSDAMALGTIIYGTHFIIQNKPYFTCEQLYYYKGIDVKRDNKKSYSERLQLLVEMFQKEVEQVAYTTTSLIVGLPIFTENYEDALDIMEKGDLPYKTYGIGVGGSPPTPPFGVKHNTFTGKSTTNSFVGTASQKQNTFLSNNRPNSFVSKGVAVNPRGGVGGIPPGVVGAKPLLVKADLTADTYSLYDPKDNTLVGTAMVPTYKSSVFLNGLFRNIKENKNLDFLEESDDEDEFENIQLDKFVNLDKKILMECVFIKRFQKWQPMKVIKIC
jgi:hypothetical protein